MRRRLLLPVLLLPLLGAGALPAGAEERTATSLVALDPERRVEVGKQGLVSGWYASLETELIAVLTADGEPVPGAEVVLLVGGRPCPAVTDERGLASCVLPFSTDGQVPAWSASFAGDDALLPSSAQGRRETVTCVRTHLPPTGPFGQTCV